MSKEERIELYNNQIALEKKIINAAENTVKYIKNDLVKELILGVAMDSQKHASLLRALVASFGSTPLIAEEITNQLKKNLEEHIELEQKAIDSYKELWGDLEDEKEKIVIKAILNDEIRHHSLLKQLHKKIVEKETITEQDLWDLTWKDSVSHGSPGG
jgi:rubrerythrin